MQSSNLAEIASHIAGSSGELEDQELKLAMFLAAMVAEPRRNKVAHVTIMLILGDANDEDKKGIFAVMPMTGGVELIRMTIQEIQPWTEYTIRYPQHP